MRNQNDASKTRMMQTKQNSSQKNQNQELLNKKSKITLNWSL